MCMTRLFACDKVPHVSVSGNIRGRLGRSRHVSSSDNNVAAHMGERRRLERLSQLDVLAAVAGGARSLLDARGELRPGLVLKASVAASLRGPSEQPQSGNRAGIMIVPLPVGEPDADRRLVGIVGATTERKRQPPYQPNARLPQRWMVRVMARQRLVNLLVSNLPGPPAPLYFAGARVREIFQIGVVQGNISVSIGALSYAGQLSFDIVGDCDATPDLAVFAGGVPDALEQLGHPGRAYGARAVARSAHAGFPGSARSSSTVAPAAASAARDVW